MLKIGWCRAPKQTLITSGDSDRRIHCCRSLQTPNTEFKYCSIVSFRQIEYVKSISMQIEYFCYIKKLIRLALRMWHILSANYTCFLYIYYIFIKYLLYNYYIIAYVYYKYIIYLLYIYDLFTIYLLYIYCIFTISIFII